MRKYIFTVAFVMALAGNVWAQKSPVDYVNPYIGNISHLLVPTFPTTQLPNSMLRVYPMRADYTSVEVSGLPIIVTNHRERSAFRLLPFQGERLAPTCGYDYDNERLTPYSYDIELLNNTVQAHMAVSHQSAIYAIDFDANKPASLVLATQNGTVRQGDGWVSGWQTVAGQTKVYVYMEAEAKPVETGVVAGGKIDASRHEVSGRDVAVAMRFAPGTRTVRVRYGVSFISEEQAKNNLRREIADYDVAALAQKGRELWNATLSRLNVKGGATDDEMRVFYTAYYRTFERPISLSEDGRYWSGEDNKVHDDGGTPFLTDDWIWDTYRAAHPLRILTDPKLEENIVDSYFRMAQQNGHDWMPTFPEVNGDSRRMNSNHGVAMVADALVKGLNVDAHKAFDYSQKAIEEKTLAPWSGNKAGYIDQFYKQHGYIPALPQGAKEFDPNVNPNEKRQPVAVTLGTAYDEWCLSQIASVIAARSTKKKERAAWQAKSAHYAQLGQNYRNLWNATTQFFHPKDSAGRFIEPFDYRYSGGQGAREAYGENNGWTYRWDVPHDIDGLVELMGGKAHFAANLDQTFREPLGKGKYEFYATLPDHTGNVGQFSMANEPSFHIPYLYNYAGQAWKTQKTLRKLIRSWYRNDLMGIPGDEDGGGMSAFVVFSMMGFYPITPGCNTYAVGAPYFEHTTITLGNGKTLTLNAPGVSETNKYIQSMTVNGKPVDQPFFDYDDIKDGGIIDFVMGEKPKL